MTLTLPWPPSVNGYWRSIVRGGQVQQIISERGRKYRDNAIAEVWRQIGLPRPLTGRLAVEWVLHAPTRRECDLSNFVKAPEDVLTHAKVWGDDSQIDRMVVVRGEVRPRAGCVVVTILEL